MTINKQRVELLLAERGLTKAELAVRCGMSRQNLSTITTRGTASPRNVGRLAAALGVPVSALIEEV